MGLSLVAAIGIACIPTSQASVSALGESQVIKDGELQPVMTQAEKLDAFTEEGKYKISNIYGDISYGLDMVGLIGKEIPETELQLLNGETLNTNTFEEKLYVIEVVASWCEYCQQSSKEYMSEIIGKNTDLEFVQIFAEGNTSEVNSFYEAIDKDPSNYKYIVPAADASNELVSKLNIQGFPTWIFVDSDGKISWIHSGLLDTDDFSVLRDAAYTGDKLYAMLNEDFDDSRAGVTVDDVYNALSSEAITAIQNVETEGSYMVFANLARKFTNFTATDINGEEFDLSELSGKKVMIDIEVADDSFTDVAKNEEKAAELAGVAKENDVATVQVWLAYYQEDNLITGADYRESHSYETPYDYTIDANEEQYLEEIYNIDIYNAPSQVYLNEDGVIVGVTTGEMSAERLQSAINLYYGETPVYDMLNEELLEASESSQMTTIKNVGIAVFVVIALMSGGFLVFELRKKEPVSEEEKKDNN